MIRKSSKQTVTYIAILKYNKRHITISFPDVSGTKGACAIHATKWQIIDMARSTLKFALFLEDPLPKQRSFSAIKSKLKANQKAIPITIRLKNKDK